MKHFCLIHLLHYNLCDGPDAGSVLFAELALYYMKKSTEWSINTIQPGEKGMSVLDLRNFACLHKDYQAEGIPHFFRATIMALHDLSFPIILVKVSSEGVYVSMFWYELDWKLDITI